MILPRYIFRRVLAQFLGVTAVLSLVVVVLQFTRVLARAAADRFPTDLLLTLVAWGAAQNVAVVLPVALLIGIVLALGRLYEDHEMAAMAACGTGGLRTALPVVVIVVITAGVLAWLTLVYNPKAAAQLDAQKTRALQIGTYANLHPGEFRSFDASRLVLYAESVSTAGELAGVFAQRLLGDAEVVIVANRGHIERDGNRMPLAIVLEEGTYYEMGTHTLHQRFMAFEQLRVPLELSSAARTQSRVDAIPTSALLRSRRLPEIAELQGRLALPAMALMLGLIAIPMSRLRPRQGRYGRAALAILIYFLYANLITAGGTWIADGRTPAWAGLWWVHALAAATASIVFASGRRPT
ncbi:MAG: LPS export ABC transporter permease LptF [Gammaproteobacteria bacterium]